jgi:pilus assembly protein CpaF
MQHLRPDNKYMNQRVFVIVGSKGGSGATTIGFDIIKALNAVKVRSILVDGDLAGRRSHAVSYDVVQQLDENRSPSSPALVTATECDLLEITNSYEAGFAVRTEAVENFIAKLPEASVVVADLPQPLAAVVRPFVANASRFIVVVEPTLLGVSSARQLLLNMSRFGIPSNRIMLLLNNRDGNTELKRNDIKGTLQISDVVELPSRRDRNYNRAIQSLVDSLLKLPHLKVVADLQPSAMAPVGDRRLASRLTQQQDEVVSAPAEPALRVFSAYDTTKTEIQKSLMSEIDFGTAARMYTDVKRMAELRAQVDNLVTSLIAERKDIASVEDGARLKQEVVQEALGLGPIEGLMHDDTITEIMVNGPREVYIERAGKIFLTTNQFVDEQQVKLVIERVLAPLGRRIDESTPMVDARLPDGSRVNATIPPMSIDGPTLTIRRFGKVRLNFDALKAAGAANNEMVDFLRACVQARLNIVVSGGTGSGKTTLLNAMSSFIPRTDRIITIEDAAELLLVQPHVIRLESRPPNLEGGGEIRIRECVRNALRMRPDRIIVGECRGAEALDMLQAMNTGHDGSLTSVHANTARDALARIETMVLMAGFDLPVRAIREQVSSAVNIVVQVSRFSDGSRKIASISEVIGMEGDIITMQELIAYKQHGVDANSKVLGGFTASGVQPSCLRRFDELGIDFDPVTFGASFNSVVSTWSPR